jgi:hypothetical protein
MIARTFIIALSLALGGTVALPTVGEATTPLAITYVCNTAHGRPDSPLVATYAAAEAIFLAIERSTNPHTDTLAFPDIFVRQTDMSWEVYRWNSKRGDRGSQLGIRIDRCSGAISDVVFGAER